MHRRTGALQLAMDTMSPTPTWFLHGLRWYVLLPATVTVSLTAPRAPRLVSPDAGAGLAEGGALLYALLAYVILFCFARGVQSSLVAGRGPGVPWPVLGAALVATLAALGASAWLTVMPATTAPPFGLVGAFAWCRAMLMAGLVGPALILDELAANTLAARKRATLRP